MVPTPPFKLIPSPELPEMMLRSAADGPPMFTVTAATSIPEPFGTAVVPAASTPMWHAFTTIGPVADPELTAVEQPPMERPLIVPSEPEKTKPEKFEVQVTAITGVPA